jgi:hypothetical protein
LRRWGGGAVSEVSVPLVAVERVGSVDRFWGPFADVDDVVRFCRERGCVVSVSLLYAPVVE